MAFTQRTLSRCNRTPCDLAMPDNNNKDSNNNTCADQPQAALTIDEARDAILRLIPVTTKTETVSLANAIGRITATDCHAVRNIPPFRNSAMDGYAIREQDLKTDRRFKIIATSLAGHPHTNHLSEGEAVRVTTGAAIPDNADAIVIQELVNKDADTFTTNAVVKTNQYIRNPGDDIADKQQLISANSALKAADIGLLAAQGIEQVEVFAKARVGVFSTGDELCDSQQTLKSGQIYDSNRITIQSLLKKAGVDTVDLGICRDNRSDLQRMMELGTEFDFLLSSGGVSVGEADHVKDALENSGELLFWKVAMKPGKPLVSGKLHNGAFYFGLPGNPVSSMVTCIQFVIPAIQAMSGVKFQTPISLQAKSLSELKKEPGRFEFQRGKVYNDENGELTVSTTGLQDSHVLSSMTQANCFICLDQFVSGAKQGEQVSIILFDSYPAL